MVKIVSITTLQFEADFFFLFFFFLGGGGLRHNFRTIHIDVHFLQSNKFISQARLFSKGSDRKKQENNHLQIQENMTIRETELFQSSTRKYNPCVGLIQNIFLVLTEGHIIGS